MNKVEIRVKDKETGEVSLPATLYELVYRQNEVEFIFGDYDSVLPFKDFLFFQDEYEVIVDIKND